MTLQTQNEVGAYSSMAQQITMEQEWASYLKAPEGDALEKSVKLDFQASNNEAEYEALLAEVKLATDRRVPGEG